MITVVLFVIVPLSAMKDISNRSLNSYRAH